MGVDAIGCVGVLEEGFPVEADSRSARRLSSVDWFRRFRQSKDAGSEFEEFSTCNFRGPSLA